jgi:hydrogenase/urease accessory protein HupE
MWRVIFLLLVTLWPETAWAHGSIPGMQGFYWGMLHPFTSGPQILALFALSLVLQQRQPNSQDMLIGFLAGCIAGAAAAALGITGLDSDVPLTLFAVATGILTASALKLPVPALTVTGGIGGLLNGYVSWPDPGSASGMMPSALGAIVGSALIVIVVAGLIEIVRQKTGWAWLPIAVRVAGSWLAAISVLLGALLFRNMP